MDKNESDQTPLNRGLYSDYNAIFTGHHFARKTFIGTFRNPRRFSWIEWVFLVVSTVSMLGLLALSIERFVFFEKNFYNLTTADSKDSRFHCSDWHCTTDFIFSVLLVLNLIFCFFYCYDGLLRERKFELLAFVGATVFLIVFIAGKYIFDFVRHHDITVIKKVRLGLLCSLGPVNIVLAIIGWWKMGYFVFNIIGANKKLSNAYQLKAFVTTLQYFHLEIMANVVALSFAFNGTLLSTPQKVIIPVVLAYLVVVIFLGSMSVHWEKKVGVMLWYTLLLPCAVFYIYEIVEVSLSWSDYTTNYTVVSIDGSKDTFSIKFVGVALLIAVSLGLIAICILMICMIFVTRNFNLGLKEKVDPPLAWCIRSLQTRLSDYPSNDHQ